MVNKMKEEKENLMENSRQNTAEQKAVKRNSWEWGIYTKRFFKDMYFDVTSIGRFPLLSPDDSLDWDDLLQYAYLTFTTKDPWNPHLIGELPETMFQYTGPLLIDDPAILADYGLKDCKVAKLEIVKGKVISVKPIA